MTLKLVALIVGIFLVVRVVMLIVCCAKKEGRKGCGKGQKEQDKKE